MNLLNLESGRPVLAKNYDKVLGVNFAVTGAFRLFLYPIEKIQIRHQWNPAIVAYRHTSSGLVHLWKQEGHLRGLFRGASIVFTHTAMTIMPILALDEYLRYRLSQGSKVNMQNEMIAAVVAAAAQQTFNHPLQRVRLLIQTQSHGTAPNFPRWFLPKVLQMYTFREMYTGFSKILLNSTMLYGPYLSLFAYSKRYSDSNLFHHNFGCGLGSYLIARTGVAALTPAQFFASMKGVLRANTLVLPMSVAVLEEAKKTFDPIQN